MVKDSTETGAKQSLKHYHGQLTFVLLPFNDGNRDGGT